MCTKFHVDSQFSIMQDLSVYLDLILDFYILSQWQNSLLRDWELPSFF